MSDPAKADERAKAWGKIFTDIMADAPWIPIFNEQRVVVRSKRMGGEPSIYIDPTRVLNYDALWIRS
jgi:ABC-type transport system substrate-binding protein